MVKEELCEKVVEVRRASDRVMTVVNVFEENWLRLMYGYVPRSGRTLKEKVFYDELKCEWDMHSVDDLVMYLGSFSGYIGRHIDGLDGEYGGHGAGQRNLEGKMLLEFLSGEGIMSIKYMA